MCILEIPGIISFQRPDSPDVGTLIVLVDVFQNIQIYENIFNILYLSNFFLLIIFNLNHLQIDHRRFDHTDNVDHPSNDTKTLLRNSNGQNVSLNFLN